MAISKKNQAAIKKTQFKKGHKKSVGFGRPKMTDAEKELSLKTRTQLKTIFNKYMITEISELKKLYKKKNIPALDGMIIKSILNAHNSGDQTAINWFLNHSLGKEKEVSHINLNTNTVNLKNLSKEELLALKEISKKSNESN